MEVRFCMLMMSTQWPLIVKLCRNILLLELRLVKHPAQVIARHWAWTWVSIALVLVDRIWTVVIRWWKFRSLKLVIFSIRVCWNRLPLHACMVAINVWVSILTRCIIPSLVVHSALEWIGHLFQRFTCCSIAEIRRTCYRVRLHAVSVWSQQMRSDRLILLTIVCFKLCTCHHMMRFESHHFVDGLRNMPLHQICHTVVTQLMRVALRQVVAFKGLTIVTRLFRAILIVAVLVHSILIHLMLVVMLFWSAQQWLLQAERIVQSCIVCSMHIVIVDILTWNFLKSFRVKKDLVSALRKKCILVCLLLEEQTAIITDDGRGLELALLTQRLWICSVVHKWASCVIHSAWLLERRILVDTTWLVWMLLLILVLFAWLLHAKRFDFALVVLLILAEVISVSLTVVWALALLQ